MTLPTPGQTVGMAAIDITPDADGYAAIVAMFARSVIDDVAPARQSAASDLLVQALEIAFYLGRMSADDMAKDAKILRDRMTIRISTYLPR